jgi:hypothetical protein
MYNIELSLVNATSTRNTFKKDFEFKSLEEAIRFIKYHLNTELNTEDHEQIDRNIKDYGEFTIWCKDQQGRARFTIKQE